MYYRLVNDSIVTEREMENAFSIIHGRAPCSCELDEWANALYTIKEIIPEEDSNETINILLNGNRIVEAVMVYRRLHDCSLSEAKAAIDSIRYS